MVQFGLLQLLQPSHSLALMLRIELVSKVHAFRVVDKRFLRVEELVVIVVLDGHERVDVSSVQTKVDESFGGVQVG